MYLDLAVHIFEPDCLRTDFAVWLAISGIVDSLSACLHAVLIPQWWSFTQ